MSGTTGFDVEEKSLVSLSEGSDWCSLLAGAALDQYAD